MLTPAGNTIPQQIAGQQRARPMRPRREPIIPPSGPGSEMIVWGGVGNISGYLNTGGRYDPVTDSWTATSITNAPEARYLHTAVWTGTRMVVWGGFGNINGPLNTGGRYDPATDSWTATSSNAPEA